MSNDFDVSSSYDDLGRRGDCDRVDSLRSFRRSLTPREYELDSLCRSHRKNRRGAAAVEFAVIAPVFILLVFGMVEFGRMVMVQQVLTNASREGARRAVLDGATSSEVTTTVNDYLQNSTVQGATVTISPNPPNNAGFGEPVTVTISVPFSSVSWLPTPMYLGQKTLSASTVMRRESAQ